MSQIQLYYLLSRSYLIQQFQHIQQCNKFNSLIWFNSIISFNSFKYSTFSKIKFYYLFHIHISFNTPTYSTGSQIQLYNLISHSHLIQQSHIFNNVTNLTLLSRFTFSSIYKCHKFISFIWFNSLISCNSPTYPKVQQSQWSYLVYILIPLNSPTHSTVSHIQLFYLVLHYHLFQKCTNYLFYLIPQSNFIQSPTYSKVQHSQWFLSRLHSHILQQSHLFNIVTNSVVLSNFSFMSPSIVPHIQPCNKFNCFISFYILIYFKSVQITSFIWFHSLISFKVPHIQKCNKVNCLISLHSHLFQQSHLFNSVTNSVVLSTFTFISHSTVPTYSTM